jgi:GTP-binding protein
MKISTASFLKAAEHPRDYPKEGLVELAFAGRSNVGKSSMINTLLARHSLVRTSRTPGCTRTLNFFVINERIIFVDLPGYGFARVPEHVKRTWGPMMETYLASRRELAGLVLVVDARLGLTESDSRMHEYATAHGIPLVVVATKADKLGTAERRNREKAIHAAVGENVPVVLFSSRGVLGKNELWTELKNLIECGPSSRVPIGPRGR